MFELETITKNLSDTYRKGLSNNDTEDFLSKLISNNIKYANKYFISANREYNEKQKYFISRVIAYTTCEIYNKLQNNFKETQLERICKKSTNRVCSILKQPIDEDSQENEIMTMVSYVLPVIIKTESISEMMRFNPVKFVKHIIVIQNNLIKFFAFLSEIWKFSKEYFNK